MDIKINGALHLWRHDVREYLCLKKFSWLLWYPYTHSLEWEILPGPQTLLIL